MPTPPYYIVPDVERYKSLDPSSEEAKKLACKLSANIGDLISLRLILGIDPPEFARFYPDMELSDPSTLDTIDAFLEKFGQSTPIPESLQDLQDPPTPPSPSETSDTPKTSNNPKTSETSETLRDLQGLIRSHRYQEAIMLIEEQNLINPQKSIYFAHQMRFLKKLIAIDKYKNKSKR